MKKKVLIITYDMIPHTASWGGCQRMYYLAEFLTRRDVDVTVFSCRKQTNDDYGNKIHFSIQPIAVKNRFFANFINSKARGNCDVVNNKSLKLFSEARRFIKGNKMLFNIIGKADKFIYNEPTAFGGIIARQWVSENIDHILAYIRKNNIGVVIISVPAYGMLSAGPLIKKEFKKVRLIYDYRDPWNMWEKTGHGCYMTEKKYLHYADEIVCTNKNLCIDMAKEFKISKRKFHVVANGYSEEKWKVVDHYKRKSDNKFVISYIGQIEILYRGIRNIEKFMEAFRRFGREKEDVLLRFIGVNDVTLDTVTSLKREFRNIEIMPPVSAVESLEYMLESDVLLLLHTTDDTSSKYIVSGKFYDYARSGKAILSIDNGNGMHHLLVTKNKLGISVRNESREIEEAMRVLYLEWKNGDMEKYKNSNSAFSREFQNEKYLRLIQQES